MARASAFKRTAHQLLALVSAQSESETQTNTFLKLTHHPPAILATFLQFPAGHRKPNTGHASNNNLRASEIPNPLWRSSASLPADRPPLSTDANAAFHTTYWGYATSKWRDAAPDAIIMQEAPNSQIAKIPKSGLALAAPL